MESFEISEFFLVKPEKIYEAWLDSGMHSEMTGSLAECDPVISGKFTAWDGYISGTNIDLEPGKKIVQEWRTTEFPEGSPDSVVEIEFMHLRGGTRLLLRHSSIPDGQGPEYMTGWVDYYFSPMKEFFGK